MTTHTHTLAALEILPATYKDIRSRLELAGYAHAIDDENEHIDMTGLSLFPMRRPPTRSLTRERLDEIADELSNSRDLPIVVNDEAKPSLPTTIKSFRHYKGGTYTLLTVARDSEARNILLAVYVSHQTQQVWVRTWLMFNEMIVWPDGIRRPRFIELTPDDPASQR